ncbi:MAG: lysophospholipid acyltransferase family protein [Kiritimatiellia bacterium]
MKHRPKHWAEYLLLRGVCAVVGALPYRPALCLAAGLARVGFALAAARRKEAIRRIRLVLGDGCTPRQARAIAWQSLRNVAFNLAEILYVGGGRPRSLPVAMDMQDALDRVRAFARDNPGRGGIFACPHMGNWELAGIVVPASGIDMFTLTGVQKNPLVQDYLQRLRHAPGVELLPRGSGTTLRKIFANLRKGKFLAIMPDLRSRLPGVRVRFFGGEANLYPGMGHFARQVDVPIFLAIMKRRGWTHHSIELHGPFEPDSTLSKDEDAQRLSQLVMDIVDAEIRQDPGQWFWYNKRWILDPLEPEAQPDPEIPPAS